MAHDTAGGGGAVQLRRACAVNTRLGFENKRHPRPPHLLAQLRGSSSTAKRRRRRETAAAEALGFRRLGSGARGGV
jgi:hypothetical protein